jgi:hypothetical protein
MTIFPQYEQQLRDLARVQQAGAAPSRSRPTRARWRQGTAVPAIAVAVTVAVVAGVLASVGGHTRRATSRATSPAAVQHAKAPPRELPLPVTSLTTLRQVLGVLRRPQVSSDRTDPFFKPHSPLHPILKEERRLVSTPGGLRIWITPSRAARLTSRQATEINDPVQFWFNARYHGGSAGAQITAERIESADAIINASNGQTSGSFRRGAKKPPTSIGPQLIALLAPDGVARVVGSLRGVGRDAAPVTAIARVHRNLAILRFTEPTSLDHRTRIRWYNASGRQLPIPYTPR